MGIQHWVENAVCVFIHYKHVNIRQTYEPLKAYASNEVGCTTCREYHA